MSFNDDLNINLDALLERGNVDGRAELDPNATCEMSSHIIAEMKSLIETELKILTVEAKAKADIHWLSNEMMREEGSEDEQWRYGTRVRLRGNTFSAEWYQNRFVKEVGKSKNRVFSTHIRKGRGHSYKRSAFKSANETELESIERTESHYKKAREKAEVLTAIRRLIKQYEKL